MSQPKPTPDVRGLRTVADLATVGLTLAISVGLGTGIGYYLDQVFKTNWLVIVFTLLGVAAGFRQLVLAVIRANREEERIAKDRRDGSG